MNTQQVIAHILKTEGVEWISCFPSNNLIEAVAKEGIRPIMFRQERGALMAADGYSRMNNRRRFGVVRIRVPPGRSTRRNSATPGRGSGRCSISSPAKSASKLASRNARGWASATAQRTPGKASRRERSRSAKSG